MLNKLTVSSSPHIHVNVSTTGIMFDVTLALFPATVFGVIIYGISAATLIAVCIISSMLAEYIWNKILKKENSLSDLSAVVTGLLLGLNLPPKLPIWMAVVGSFIAIIIVKQMFGGLGHNFVNPAITARIILMVSFPSAMTKFYEPFGIIESTATPLAQGNYSIKELLLGMHGGSIGETSALMLMLGGLYLIMRRVISPIIPVSFIGTVFIMSYLLGVNPFYSIFSGGLMLAAIFMATDYVTSPVTRLGGLIFGIGCGIITAVIRIFGALPEGVSYSILFMNLLVPHIDRLCMPKPFGSEVRK